MNETKIFIVEFTATINANSVSEAKKKFIQKMVNLCGPHQVNNLKQSIQVTNYTCKECGSHKGLHGYYGPNKEKLCSKALTN